jgi:hypothetical protein
MSTTNPAPGQPPADDSHGFGKPDAETVKRGYEIDRYDTTSVLSVPVLVVVFFVLAFFTTTILFWYFTNSVSFPNAHPQAVERNQVALNERLARINRGSKDVDQPRLEPLRQRGPNERAIPSPEVGQNPPYLHPEDIRAEPGRTPELFGRAKTPIDKIIAAADKNLFPVQKEKSGPLPSTNVSTEANAGRGAGHAIAVMPELPVLPEKPKNDAPAPKGKDNQPPKPMDKQPTKGPEGGKK